VLAAAERERFPRAGRHSLLPGGFGTTPGRHYDRSATMIAGLGLAGAANGRLLAWSQEVRLKLSGGVGSPPQEPRWNAGRRARPTADGRRKPPFPWRAPHPLVRCLDYASAGVPLPFFGSRG